MRYVLSLFWILCSSVSLAGPHHHHLAKLSIVLESDKQGKEVIIVAHLPSPAIIGFEHRPRNQQQMAQQKKRLDHLKHLLPQLMTFDPSRKCSVKNVSTEVVYMGHTPKHHHHSKHKKMTHSEVKCEAVWVCEQPVYQSDVNIHFKTHYPDLHDMRIEVISDKQVHIQGQRVTF